MGYVDVRILIALAAWPSERHAQTASGLTPRTHSIVQPRRTGWIEDCYVLPQARRQGIGTALVDEARGSRAQHVSRVALAVLVANREGLAFLEHQGFAPVRMLLSREVESARRRIPDFCGPCAWSGTAGRAGPWPPCLAPSIE